MTTRDITRRAGRSCRDSTGRAAAPRGPWFGSAARQLLPDTRGVNTTARHKNISVRAKILHNHKYWLYQKLQLKFQDRQCIVII